MPNPGQTIPGAQSIPAVDTNVQKFEGTISNSVDVDLYGLAVRKGQVIHYKIEDTWTPKDVDKGLRAAIRLFDSDGNFFFGHANQTTNGYEGSFKRNYDGPVFIGISSAPNNAYIIKAVSITPKPYKGHNLKGGYKLSVWGENANPSLVIYPGEGLMGKNPFGHIYVVGGKGESYEMSGGPSNAIKDGGHIAEPTPRGQYVLADKEHHSSNNWPNSVIPWGASIREHNGEIEYQVGQNWIVATGPKGTVTLAVLKFRREAGEHPSIAKVIPEVRKAFYSKSGA